MLAVASRSNYFAEEPCFGNDSSSFTIPEGDFYTWTFSDLLIKQKTGFFKPLVKTHETLNLKYRALCAMIKNRLNQSRSCKNKDDDTLTKHLLIALMLAEFFEHIYRVYLPSPSQIKRLQKQQKSYQNLLNQRTSLLFAPKQKPIANFHEEINHAIGSVLWSRVFLQRTQHLILTTIPFASSLKNYESVVKNLDHWVSPLFSSLGWLFHGGRLLLNLMYLFEHVIPGKWMSPEEKALGWQIRLKAHLQRLWVEIVNDAIWVVSTLIPAYIFFSVAICVFETIVTGLQSLIEITRIKRLQRELSEYSSSPASSVEEDTDKVAAQQFLKQCLTHEQKKLILRIVNLISITAFTILKAALPVLVPSLAVNPIIPMAIALSILAMTALCHLISKWLDSQKPSEKITKKIGDKNPEKSMYSTRFLFFSSKYDHDHLKPKYLHDELSAHRLNPNT
jgi:hypothetical protein